MKINNYKISTEDICKKINRLSIESIFESTFAFGLETAIDSDVEERNKKWRKTAVLHPWNIIYLFNLSLLKNFKQPEKEINAKETAFLLMACWENFNGTKGNPIKVANAMLYNEAIFQESYFVHSLRNLFFLKEIKLNQGVEIIKNPKFNNNIIEQLICTAHFIKVANDIINKFEVRDVNLIKKVYLEVLRRLNVLNDLTGNYSNLQGYVDKETDKLNAMLTISPLFQWPLVEYKQEIFIPCPQMIVMSTCYSLINRVSFNLPPNSNKVLSNAMEQYVFNILNSSKNVTNIHKEFLYGNKRKQKLTSDIIFSANNKLVFCECKLKRVSKKFRQLNVDKIDEMINELAESFIQLYKCILDFKNGKFNFEFVKGMDYYLVGIVVVSENIPHNLVEHALGLFKEKCIIDNIDIHEEIIESLKMVSLYQLEDAALRGTEVLNLFGFNYSEESKVENSFIKELEEELHSLHEKVCKEKEIIKLYNGLFENYGNIEMRN